ncbi:MAG: hypothetical protein JKY96_04820 [Phycisphaerales bacterium]|nr:hypothetical protein [Phycisphaerales bacterium]
MDHEDSGPDTAEDTTLTFDQAAEQISELDDEDFVDGEGDSQDHARGGETLEDEGFEDDEIEPDDDGDDAEQDPELIDDEDGEKPTGESQFTNHDSVVQLEDGTEVSVADLINGRMMHEAFEAGTAENNTQREALLQDRQTAHKWYEHLVTRIDQTEKILSIFAGEPDPALATTDPERYAQQVEQYRHAKEVLQVMGDDKTQGQQHFDEQQKVEHKAFVDREYTALVAAAPDFKTKEGFENQMRFLEKGLQSYGISSDEIRGVEDHRFLLIARDAAKYRALQSKGSKSRKRALKTPVASSKRRQRSTNEQNVGRFRKQQARHKQSGSESSAAALLMDYEDEE